MLPVAVVISQGQGIDNPPDIVDPMQQAEIGLPELPDVGPSVNAVTVRVGFKELDSRRMMEPNRRVLMAQVNVGPRAGQVNGDPSYSQEAQGIPPHPPVASHPQDAQAGRQEKQEQCHAVNGHGDAPEDDGVLALGV